ncbi:hypothetical protein TL16_g06331 [Triparma laevis f. inornata]|uniref:Rhodanese domain-containing protein n=1 Tax=Triparma laevis f. inornata TaxID=1714386 RepID=A0A9W7ARV2_9STRA|nr:hypothetical protein TL16_g06331 [Triparma laevis f. inornata]
MLISKRAISIFLISNRLLSTSAIRMSSSTFPTAPLASVPSLDTTWYLNPPSPLPSPTSTQPPFPSPFAVNSLSCGPGTHAPPSPTGLSSYLTSLSIKSTDPIQLYQSPKGLALYRSYYLLKHVFNHSGSISILQTPYTTSHSETSYTPYTTTGTPLTIPDTWGPLVSKTYVKKNLESDDHVILDARPYLRFTAEQKETREGCTSGHIKGSKSLPFPQLCADDLTALKSISECQEIFESKGVDFSSDQKIILTCGSGEN